MSKINPNGIYKPSLARTFFDKIYDIRIKLFKSKSTKIKAGNGRRRSSAIFLISMLILPLINFIVFFWVVNFSSLVMAFTDINNQWNNFEHFIEFWKQLWDPASGIGAGVKNTLLFFALNILMMPSGLVFSYFIFKKIFMYKTFRFIYYLPGIIPALVMVSLFKEMVKPWGPAIVALEKLGINFPEIGLLASEATAKWTIMVYCIWMGLSGAYLIYCSAMARVPTEVFEAAKLDGCSLFRELVSIVFPLIWPTFSTLLIFSCTGIFTSSGPILLFTKGAYGTTTLQYWIFSQVYEGGSAGHFGLVSATGFSFTLIGLPIILFAKWLIEKVPTSEY